MKLSCLKVSKSDERLAHGVVKSRAAQLFEPKYRSLSLRKFKEIKTAKALVEFVTNKYGKRVLYLYAGRLTGERARVDAIVADACKEGGYMLGIVSWYGNLPPSQRLQMDVRQCYVEHHAVARMIHRGLGSGDVNEAVARIFRPLIAWGSKGETPTHNRIILRGFGGEVRCIVDQGWIIAKTWIDSDSLPEWKREQANAEELTVQQYDENNSKKEFTDD